MLLQIIHSDQMTHVALIDWHSKTTLTVISRRSRTILLAHLTFILSYKKQDTAYNS